MILTLINVAYFFSTILSEELCYLPLDVMFLQDTTGSFEDDLPNVLMQIPEMVETITRDFPSSHFGVAEFKDKPYYPLGEASDFCYKLGDGKLSGDVEDFHWAYSLLYASGGGDLPEASFQSLINIALDPLVGWRPLAASGTRALATDAGARIVIMSTDAQPHLPGDIEKFDPIQFPDLPRGLPANSGEISTDDVDYECFLQDYPSADQVKTALRKMNIYLVILTPEDPAIVPSWKWVNENLLEQPSSFYQFISADSSDLLSGVLKAVEAVTQHACPTTTTPEPTTPTTSASAVTASSSFATVTPEMTTTTETTMSSTIETTAETPSAESSSQDVPLTPVGSTEGSTTTPTEMTVLPTTAECPPCIHPTSPNDCPPCVPPCIGPKCNEGVLIVISDKPKHVNITLS